MNREQTKKLLPVIQAYTEGKQVQYKRDTNDSWDDIESPNWHITGEYRIKPEPQKFWVLFNRRGEPVSVFSHLPIAYLNNNNYALEEYVRHGTD